jgi:hypothetical protein
MDILVAKRRLRRLTIVTLILLTFEGWAGDAVNLFAIYPANHLSSITPYSYFQYIENVRGIGPILLAHEIVALFALGFALSTMLFALSVNYPALTDGALGFPVAFTTHLHLPFGVFTYPRPVPLVKARAMLIDAFRSRLYTIPHLGQRYSLPSTWVTYPHLWQVLDVFLGFMYTTLIPCILALYSTIFV